MLDKRKEWLEELRRKREAAAKRRREVVRRNRPENDRIEKITAAINLVAALISLGLAIWAARHGG